MVEHLGKEIDFWIVTSDRDITDTQPYSGVTPNCWTRVGHAHVLYTSPQNRTIAAFTDLIRRTPHDVLYLNSFFEPTFALKPLLALRSRRAPRKPIVLAPRGEFSEAAVAIKRWKKTPYIIASRLLRLHDNVTWHASSEYEQEDIRRVMGRAAKSTSVAPNLSRPASAPGLGTSRKRQVGDTLRICFLSRITPKKNLDFALRALAHVSVPVEFNIYGPVSEEPYWALCEKLIGKLGRNVVVRSHGSIIPSAVPTIMAEHDLFFLPTRGENYGHVIAEALSAGTPVLIADTTPWRDLEAVGVGWDLPLDSRAGFVQRIEYCAGLGGQDYDDLRERARAYAAGRLHDPAIVEANRRLFLNAIGNKTPKPVQS